MAFFLWPSPCRLVPGLELLKTGNVIMWDFGKIIIIAQGQSVFYKRVDVINAINLLNATGYYTSDVRC